MKLDGRFFRNALQKRVKNGEFHERGAGGADGDGMRSSEFIEIRPLSRSESGLGVLHYLDKTLAEVDEKKRHSVRMTDFLIQAHSM